MVTRREYLHVLSIGSIAVVSGCNQGRSGEMVNDENIAVTERLPNVERREALLRSQQDSIEITGTIVSVNVQSQVDLSLYSSKDSLEFIAEIEATPPSRTDSRPGAISYRAEVSFNEDPTYGRVVHVTPDDQSLVASGRL